MRIDTSHCKQIDKICIQRSIPLTRHAFSPEADKRPAKRGRKDADYALKPAPESKVSGRRISRDHTATIAGFDACLGD